MLSSLRLLATIPTALLVIAGFLFNKHEVDWLVVITVFLTSSFAMSWNDYIDRFIDRKKGKMWSYLYPAQSLRLAGILGLISIIGCAVVFVRDFKAGYLILIMVLGSLAYAYVQRNPIIKNILVASIIASTTLFSIFDEVTLNGILIFVYLFLFFSARELVKDAMDVKIDFPEKVTLATKYGVSRTLKIAGILLLFSCLPLALISYYTVTVFVFFGGMLLLIKKDIKLAKIYINWSIILFLITVILIGVGY